MSSVHQRTRKRVHSPCSENAPADTFLTRLENGHSREELQDLDRQTSSDQIDEERVEHGSWTQITESVRLSEKVKVTC